MNWAPPAFVQEAAKAAVDEIEPNHYSVTKGRIRLRNALSKWFSPQFFDHGFGAGGKEGRKIDTDTEIVVTAGANEGASRLVSFLFTLPPNARLICLTD